MAWARRCDLGCETWPDEPVYKKCAVCGESTKRFSNARESEILTASEAARLMFEDYYERRGQREVLSDDDLARYDELEPVREGSLVG